MRYYHSGHRNRTANLFLQMENGRWYLLQGWTWFSLLPLPPALPLLRESNHRRYISKHFHLNLPSLWPVMKYSSFAFCQPLKSAETTAGLRVIQTQADPYFRALYCIRTSGSPTWTQWQIHTRFVLFSFFDSFLSSCYFPDASSLALPCVRDFHQEIYLFLARLWEFNLTLFPS